MSVNQTERPESAGVPKKLWVDKLQATKSKLVKVKPNLRGTLAYCTEIPKRIACILLVAFPLAFGVGQTPDTTNLAQGRPQELYSELAALIVKNQYDRAETVVQELLALSDDPAGTYFQIGKVYFDHEAWQLSAGFLETSIKLNAGNDRAHQLLGLDWRELRRSAEAEAELLQAAKENPSNKVNAYFAGQQLLLDGKSEAALPYLYSALDWKPIQPQTLQALVLAQARLGNYGLAESYSRKIIDSPQSSDEDRYSALVNLSVLLLLGHENARLEEGLDCARRAEKLHPDSLVAHFLAGKALFKLGRLAEATPELTRAAKLNPADSRPHFLLARIYDQLGQHDRAEKERKDIADIQGRPGQPGMSTGGAMSITLENLPEGLPR
jgi:Flp pilus assembly protein TadD